MDNKRKAGSANAVSAAAEQDERNRKKQRLAEVSAAISLMDTMRSLCIMTRLGFQACITYHLLSPLCLSIFPMHPLTTRATATLLMMIAGNAPSFADHVLQKYNFKEQPETRESTSEHGLFFLELVRRTSDKKYVHHSYDDAENGDELTPS